ncbi:MAG: glycoside hydrolase family 99-like domain-containing protein [Armatimonadetes bacterium]|nr:glycoside hydrolase family 99-like domain-containing protein [Armatimonadota bacterium]
MGRKGARMPDVILRLVVLTMLIVLPCWCQADSTPFAWYRFEDPAALGKDSSEHGRDAQAVEAQSGEGRHGLGLVLSGKGGLTLASGSVPDLSRGFTVDLWFRPDTVSENASVVNLAGVFMLRIDPPGEARRLSFFPDLNGSLEPRVRGPILEAGQWYHAVASWDGSMASLWVNGQEYSQSRPGRVTGGREPLLVGLPFKWAPAGFKGVIDEVRLYDRALSATEVLGAQFGLAPDPQGPRTTEARLLPEHWQRVSGEVSATPEGLLLKTAPSEPGIAHRRLQLPVGDKPFVSLRMSVSTGNRGKLLFQTSAGPGAAVIPLRADGKMHSYVVDLSDVPQWSGDLLMLALVPSDREAETRLASLTVAATPEVQAEVVPLRVLSGRPIIRAGREAQIRAEVTNYGGIAHDVTLQLDPPPGVEVLEGNPQLIASLPHLARGEASWTVRAETPGIVQFGLRISVDGAESSQSTWPIRFDPAVDVPKADYVPAPQPPKSDILVGAHYCPLWKQGARGSGWELIEPFPEREPALSWYDEHNPEVTDWEIKWALDHGINFFVYCWYRASQGGPVEQFLGHAIHDGLFNARYRDQFKFTIMWENQARGRSGVASEEDFLTNLLPWWIDNYFKRPEYLKIDNKPVLFIYRPEYLVDDLGSVENVRMALNKARQACVDAGFAGLILLGEYRGTDPRPLQLMADEGLDYTFAYCWPMSAERPTGREAIEAQERYWKKHAEQGIIPEVLTVSMGWDSTPWHYSSSIWRLTPEEFSEACSRAKAMAQSFPETSLGSKMILLDNWNEFGEGHYISPHREYGFGYLDAARKAFTDDPPHVDLVPEDLGLGPYDSLYRGFKERIAHCAQRMVAESGLEADLEAWYTFDEPEDTGYAWDWTGNGRGGFITDAARVPGVKGKALVCDGGAVTVPGPNLKFKMRELTVSCWIKVGEPGQQDKWFINSLHGPGNAGFRMGVTSGGRLCFAVPVSGWSHHLVSAEPLPVGRWIHVVGTCNGEMIRLFADGKPCGQMERRGRINWDGHNMTIGNYEAGHRAYFRGVLDEVRIYSRALSADEVAKMAQDAPAGE